MQIITLPDWNTDVKLYRNPSHPTHNPAKSGCIYSISAKCYPIHDTKLYYAGLWPNSDFKLGWRRQSQTIYLPAKCCYVIILLSGLPHHALPILNYEQSDRSTKPMEPWQLTSYYHIITLLANELYYCTFLPTPGPTPPNVCSSKLTCKTMWTIPSFSTLAHVPCLIHTIHA